MVIFKKDLENALLHAKKDRVFITHSGCDDEVVNIVKKFKGLGIYTKKLMVYFLEKMN